MPFFGVPIRNGLPIGLGSVAGFGVQQFDPSQLFEGGTVAGAWYDPSDLSTMFDTSTGTTPVSMPGQGAAVPVGLMLDKSQGLVLGPELVTNGDFSSGTTGWTAYQSTLSAVGGKLRITATGGAPGAYQSISVVTGKTYKVTFEIDVGTVGGGTYFVGNTLFGGTFSIPSSGTYTFNLTSGTTNAAYLFYIHKFTGASAGQYFDIDNVSIKELAGNHAISFNNTTARPELRARVNLLTYSEDLTNSDWIKTNTTVTANAIANPLTGAVNADALFETTTNGQHNAIQTVTTQAARFKYSVYLKANGRARFAIAGSSGFGGNLGTGVFFDLSTGQYVSGAAGGATPLITDAGNGWWLVSYEWTANATTGVLGVYLVDSGTNTSYAGDVTKGIYIWGADLRPANIGANVPAYQRIADANTYDTNGFPLYLRFDGIDDSMYTPANLNLSGTDKVAVFAGVRQTAAGNQQLVEFSADVNANNGAFSMPKDAVGAAVWTIGLRGTSSTSASSPANYAAPITTVNAGLYDIGLSTDEAKLRINGAQVATSGAGSAGTGNFGTYPLYIGSRANSTVWFNGHLYSLVVAGSAVSAGNISATEQWVAGKTAIQI